MIDTGSLLQQEDHQRLLGRAFDTADELTTSRVQQRNHEWPIIEAMDCYGGSFVKALSYAAMCADQSNYERLRDAFPDYWQQYAAENERRNPVPRDGAITDAGCCR